MDSEPSLRDRDFSKQRKREDSPRPSAPSSTAASDPKFENDRSPTVHKKKKNSQPSSPHTENRFAVTKPKDPELHHGGGGKDPKRSEARARAERKFNTLSRNFASFLLIGAILVGYLLFVKRDELDKTPAAATYTSNVKKNRDVTASTLRDKKANVDKTLHDTYDTVISAGEYTGEKVKEAATAATATASMKIRRAAHDMKEGIKSRAKDKVHDAGSAVKDKARDFVHGGKKKVSESKEAAADKLRSKSKQYKEDISEAADKLRNKKDELIHDVEEAVEEKKVKRGVARRAFDTVSRAFSKLRRRNNRKQEVEDTSNDDIRNTHDDEDADVDDDRSLAPSFNRKYITQCEGYYRSSQQADEDLPWPRSDDDNWPDADHKREWMAKLKRIQDDIAEVKSYRGMSPSRLEKGRMLGNKEYHSTDVNAEGQPVCWTGDFLKYYVDKFNVVPSEEFYYWVLEKDLV